MQMLIKGEWRGAQHGQIEVCHPFDKRVIDTVPQATAADVEDALAAAVDAARVMEKTPVHVRMQALRLAADKMDNETEVLAKIISDESGKPIVEARGEAVRMGEMLRLAAYEGGHLRGEGLSLDALAIPPAEDKMGFTFRLPCGVVVAITPFNFPALLVMHKIASALATGTAVILKPATATPLSALKIVETLHACGLPEHALQCITGSGEYIGRVLIGDERVRKISFTGSVKIGEYIAANAGIKRRSLELGANSPCIVMPDADMEEVARLSAIAGYANAGQICISMQRALVHKRVYDDYLAATSERVERVIVGAPDKEGTKLSAMINEGEAKRVADWVDEAVADGARVVTGGERNGAVFAPTVVADVKPQMRLFCDETFGPVVGVTPVDDLDETIRLCEVGGYGLSSSIFTRDIGQAGRFVRSVKSGNAQVNRTPLWCNDMMPYGGFGKEGIGKTVREMTEVKNVVIHGVER